MDKKMVAAAVGVAVVLCAVAVVTASPRISSNTPLYTMRMEQASNKMHFLPTEKNNFTYTIERGYNLEHLVGAMFGEVALDTTPCTCEECTVDFTCPHGTCSDTCDTCFTCTNTCEGTCGPTCPGTCATCSTCNRTCANTCAETCVSSCDGTCSDTCPQTCATCETVCEHTCYTCEGETCYGTCDTCHTCE